MRFAVLPARLSCYPGFAQRPGRTDGPAPPDWDLTAWLDYTPL
jgi:hypothetical protein